MVNASFTCLAKTSQVIVNFFLQNLNILVMYMHMYDKHYYLYKQENTCTKKEGGTHFFTNQIISVSKNTYTKNSFTL